MLRNTMWTVAALLFGVGSSAQAQFLPPPNYNPYGGPALNPFLNLIRGGNTPGANAANLYLGTLPERFNRANISGLQRSIRNLDREIAGDLLGTARPSSGAEDLLDERTLSSTGHPTYFNNTGGYFGRGSVGNLRSPLQNRRILPPQPALQQKPGSQVGTSTAPRTGN